MSNMAVKVIDRLFIVVYGVAAPTDEEWSAYLRLVERHGVDRTLQLVATDGGEPTAAQHRRLADLLAGRTVPVAVLSGNARVRVTVMALSWFNRRIKAFPPSGLPDALAYLEVPASRAGLIEREVSILRREIEADRASRRRHRVTRPHPSPWLGWNAPRARGAHRGRRRVAPRARSGARQGCALRSRQG